MMGGSDDRAAPGSYGDRDEISLRELCRMAGVRAEVVVKIVDEGIVIPAGSDPRAWRFTAACVRRVRATVRLQRDLGVNLPGAALALDLLEELASVRRMLRRLGVE